MMGEPLKDVSRYDMHTAGPGPITYDAVKTSCLMRIADALERLATEPLESRTVVQRDTELMARMAQLERAMQKFPKQFEELTNHVRYAHRNMLSARDKQIRAQLKDRVADVKKYRLEARDLTKKVAQLEQQLAEARGSYSQE